MANKRKRMTQGELFPPDSYQPIKLYSVCLSCGKEYDQYSFDCLGSDDVARKCPFCKIGHVYRRDTKSVRKGAR